MNQEQHRHQVFDMLTSYHDTLSLHDIASVLGRHPETIRRWLVKRRIRSVMCGREYIVAKQWFIDFINSTDMDIITYEMRLDLTRQAVIKFCEYPRTWHEIKNFTGYCNKSHLQKHITRPLLQSGRLALTMPDRPHHNDQQYIAT